MFCFNCNTSGDHSSFECPQPQRFSRCAVCRNVCFASSGHKSWCTNKEFVSQSLSPNDTVFTTSVMVELGFRGIQNVFVKDILNDKPVSYDPLYMANDNTIVFKKKSRVVLSAVKDGEFHLNLMNMQNEVLMHIQSNNNVLVINDRYKICDGLVQTNVLSHGRPRYMNKITLKVEHSGDAFNVNLYTRDSVHTFQVSQAGVVFVDPINAQFDRLQRELPVATLNFENNINDLDVVQNKWNVEHVNERANASEQDETIDERGSDIDVRANAGEQDETIDERGIDVDVQNDAEEEYDRYMFGFVNGSWAYNQSDSDDH